LIWIITIKIFLEDIKDIFPVNYGLSSVITIKIFLKDIKDIFLVNYGLSSINYPSWHRYCFNIL